MLEKLNQGQCRQEQASESLKLQWRSAPATFACRWAVRGTGVCGHRERLRLLQQVYTSERKITTSQIININEIAFLLLWHQTLTDRYVQPYNL